MSDASATQPGIDLRATDCPRRRARLERQARVGLLPNPNQPPKPPPRRAALMGKWVDLRSSRRIKAAERAKARAAEQSAVAVGNASPEQSPQVLDTIARDESGLVSGIDIGGLMDAVRELGTDKPIRTPYAAQYRHDLVPDGETGGEIKKPSVLTAQAWLDDLEDEADSDPAPQPAPVRPRPGAAHLPRRIATVLVGGVVVAGLFLLLPVP